jgi:glycosyltransferase involved in cell wall biosynthesis
MASIGPRPVGRVPSLVSVIIPVRDGAATLLEQVDALRVQDHDGPWELVLADNGSTDDTCGVFERATEGSVAAGPRPWIDARVVDASQRPGSAHARNVGASAARGDLYCFCDADDVVEPAWLGELVRVAADHHLVGGRLDTEQINSTRVQSWRPTPSTVTRTAPAFVPSGNMAIWADCYDVLGGFDVEFLKSHDVELSQRAAEAGASFGFAPDAVVHYRFRDTVAGLARQAYRGGRATVQMAARHPDRQAPVGLREIGRLTLWLLIRLPSVVSSSRRGTWVRRAAQLAGIVVTSVRLRVRPGGAVSS